MVSVPSVLDILQDPVFGIVIIIGAFAVGTTQGLILGRAIVTRFPRLQNHAKIFSLALFLLFFANAVLSVPRFASPEKIVFSKIFEASSQGEIASIIFTILGINTGFLAVLAISVTIMTLVLLKLTHVRGSKKIFVLFFSLLILIFTGISRFTDWTPNNFEVFLYFLYQLGITIGIVAGSVRKIKKSI